MSYTDKIIALGASWPKTTTHAEPYVYTTGLDLTINNSDIVLSTIHAVGVCVEFTYCPGEAASRDDDGFPAELDITAVKLADLTDFGMPGFVLTACALEDIKPLLSDEQVEALAEVMLKRVAEN